MIQFNDKEKEFITEYIKMVYRRFRYVPLKMEDEEVKEDFDNFDYQDEDDDDTWKPMMMCIKCVANKESHEDFFHIMWEEDSEIYATIKQHILDYHYTLLDNEDQRRYEEIFEMDGYVYYDDL